MPKQFAAVAVIVCTVGVVFVAAAKVFVNPHPEAHLKALFPKAVAFTPKAASRRCSRRYAVDPAAESVGGTDRIRVLDAGAASRTSTATTVRSTSSSAWTPPGILTGAIVDYHSEPYGYFSVEPPEFAAQFKGKSIRDRVQGRRRRGGGVARLDQHQQRDARHSRQRPHGRPGASDP